LDLIGRTAEAGDGGRIFLRHTKLLAAAEELRNSLSTWDVKS
jgi:hypothetical protein